MPVDALRIRVSFCCLLPVACYLLYCTVSATHTAPEQLASEVVAYVIAVPLVEYAAIVIV